MISFGGRLLLLAVVAGTAMAGMDNEVCDVVKESYGLIPPPVPSFFELRGEFTDLLSKSTKYFEMYYDSNNMRAKYISLDSGIEHHLLFDYGTEQVIEYDILHPGEFFKRDPMSHTCTAVPMGQSPYNYIFGYKDGNFQTKHSKMYDPNEVLRFGGKYKYAYNGTEYLPERGIKVDKFRGCVYDRDLQATGDFQVYFTNEQVGPAGGTQESEVDDTENQNLLSVPVLVDGRGSAWDATLKKNIPMKSLETIIWFKGYPNFEEVKFQIPPLMNCKNYRGQKEMPKFPLAFSTRMEMTNLTQDIFGKLSVGEVLSFQEVWYDNDRELVRRDYKPVAGVDTEIYARFQSYSPVKEVYDFRTGILYTTNKASGRCFARSIRHGDFFETSKDSLYIKLGTPEEVFMMQTDDVEYKGKDFSRDIECDVWNGKYEDQEYKRTIFKETYISTNGWHEEADDKVTYGVPVKHTIIASSLEDDTSETIIETNFLKFKPRAVPLVVYDISNCIETINHKYFGIVVTVPEGLEQIVRDYRFLLLETTQSYLVAISEVVSFLRVQKLQLHEIDGKFVFTFALVGKPDFKNFQAPRGASLEDAIKALETNINNGMFVIKFVHPESQMDVYPIVAEPGSLIDLSPEKQKTKLHKVQQFQEHESLQENADEETEHKIMLEKNWIMFEEEKEVVEEKKGMSPGSLAGLSIAMLLIGIAIGVAVMYLYIRKYSDKSMENQYAMEQSTSKS